MLRKVKDHSYVVYPSWASTSLSYKWQNLPRLLADPLNSGYVANSDDPEYYWECCGYPRTPQPFKLIDGPVGGGIVMWEGDANAGRGWRWLPIVVLESEANLRLPNGMDSIWKQFDAQVVCMEPHGWGIGGGPKLYRCAVSTEHVDSAGESVYWLLCLKEGKRIAKGVGEIATWAAGFGLTVVLMFEVSTALLAESEPWFNGSSVRRIWFEVHGGGGEVGYQFAILVYIAYHLRWVGGTSVLSMHLVSDIEGKPNSRRLWTSKPESAH